MTTRLLTLLLATVAPSQRFPLLWARANRLGQWRRVLATLRARLPKPPRPDVARWAERDSAIEATAVAAMERGAQRVLGLIDSVAADAERTFDRWSPAPATTPAVGATAAALVAAVAVSVVSVFGGARPPVEVALSRVAGVADRAVSAQSATAAEPAAAEEATPTAPAPATPIPPVEVAAGAPPAPSVPSLRGALPIGKGMWLYVPERVEGGDPAAIVARARAVGLTHVYVRTGSSRMGFYAQDFLDRLLPVAHANGIRVYGWDFPYFESWSDDVFRAVAAITYTTPDGHRIDGFSADIETESEGTKVSAHHATEYGTALRRIVGNDYPLIATVPRPGAGIIARGFPYAELAAHFDAFAPMVYWMNRDSFTDAAGAMQYLSQFGRPVVPVGQAYDGGPEGGPPGVPSAESIIRFMQASEAGGAIGVSFWSWQHADQQAWDAIAGAAEFRLVAGSPDQLTRGMIVAYQAQLAQFGFPVTVNGVWDEATGAGVRSFQTAVGLPATGVVDAATLAAFHRPVPPPVRSAA